MLDPWIIEEILRREEDRRREEERGRAEIPIDAPQYRERAPNDNVDDKNRGVVIIDI